MNSKVLVGYASQYGSTQEVAEAVAAALQESGLAVDFQLMRNVRTLDVYSGVVLGAPLYMFRWHKDALHFLSRHRDALKERPVAVFALGPFHDKAEDWVEVRSEIDKELAKFPWFTPAAVEIFGGKFDPTRLRLPWSLVPALKQMPASDLRDWAAIRAWAISLRPLLVRSGDLVSELKP